MQDNLGRYYKLFTKNVVLILLPLIYAVVIILYPYPQNYDIVRFNLFYKKFKNQDFFLDDLFTVLKNSPDFMSRLIEFFLAKTGLPIEIFFFTVTYITVFIFLYVFKKLFSEANKKEPPLWMYFMVWVSISVPAVLSGIRNIHALAAVSLALYYLIYRNKLVIGYLLILYASFFHFSCYVFFLFPILRGLSIKRTVFFIFFVTIIWLIISLTPLALLDDFFPEAILEKLEYYIIENSQIKEFFNEGKVKSFLVRLFYWYSLPLTFLLVIFKFHFKIYLFKEIFFISVICLFFLFFPNVYSRYLMLLTVFIVFETLLMCNKKYSPYILWIVCIKFLLQHYFFWKTVYIYT